jgi:hypothetical protein
MTCSQGSTNRFASRSLEWWTTVTVQSVLLARPVLSVSVALNELTSSEMGPADSEQQGRSQYIIPPSLAGLVYVAAVTMLSFQTSLCFSYVA